MAKRHTLLFVTMLVVYAFAAPLAVPDKEYLTNAFADPTLVEAMIECFVDISNAKCSSEQMKIMIRAREMLRNQGRCPSCTTDDLVSMEYSMELLQSQYPLLFTRIVVAMMGDGVAEIFSGL